LQSLIGTIGIFLQSGATCLKQSGGGGDGTVFDPHVGCGVGGGGSLRGAFFGTVESSQPCGSHFAQFLPQLNCEIQFGIVSFGIFEQH
jgi:hypothetical protein